MPCVVGAALHASGRAIGLTCLALALALFAAPLQVRSTTLDTKVWEPAVVGLFQQLGNTFANEVWQGGAASGAAATAPPAINPWAADSDDSEDEQVLDAAVRHHSSADGTAGSSSAPPGPRAPLADKERWIAAKWVRGDGAGCGSVVWAGRG